MKSTRRTDGEGEAGGPTRNGMYDAGRRQMVR